MLFTRLLTFLVLFVLLDVYAFQSLKIFKHTSYYKRLKIIYWIVSIASFITMLAYFAIGFEKFSWGKVFVQGFIFSIYFAKVMVCGFLLLDDLRRLITFLYKKFFIKKQPPQVTSVESVNNTSGISRSEFLTKAGIIAGGGILTAMSWGIISGAHDYRIRRRTVFLPNLPKAFDGIRIAQLSDIHSGSFFNPTAVKGGVEMLLAEKADLIFFTGDLVNNLTKEVNDYIPIFSKITAPLGVYSVLGNHDYGDYALWASKELKAKNLEEMKAAHQQMGWQLLLDEHKMLTLQGDHVAIIGVQNWGTGGFPKYGNLLKAVQGTQDASSKILLSHDPSHWDAQVRPLTPDIDLTFSGHTHGMQFGIEIGDFRWSPVKYRYPQWADLYEEENQYLYVNRGFGYIGFPGRVGILPEITVIELKSGNNPV